VLVEEVLGRAEEIADEEKFVVAVAREPARAAFRDWASDLPRPPTRLVGELDADATAVCVVAGGWAGMGVINDLSRSSRPSGCSGS
jgi:hypothetical protein